MTEEDVKMGLYINALMEQFIVSSGTKNYNVKSSAFMSEFSEWIKSRQVMSGIYYELLEYMGLKHFADRSTAEIGKGKLDSVVLPFDTSLITRYTYGLELLSNERVIDAELIVMSEMPYLIWGNSEVTYIPEGINTFMMQNPYSYLDLFKCQQLHNSGNYDIIFGVYGDIHDKDIQAKKRLITELKARLKYPVKEQEATVNDAYYSVLATDKYVLTKRLTRHRVI